MEIILNLLQHHKDKNATLLLEREDAIELRKGLNLDTLDKDDHTYIIEIDDTVRCISLGFMHYLFRDSCKGKTRREMLRKYKLRYKTPRGHRQMRVEETYKEILSWMTGGEL